MIRLSSILLSFFLFCILFSDIGCTLNTFVLTPVSPYPLDTDFQGCFKREAYPEGKIIFFQESGNLLHGTGDGIFEADIGWSVSGKVTAEREAVLHITMGEETFDVSATRPLPDPPDDLTLQRLGGHVITLSKCNEE